MYAHVIAPTTSPFSPSFCPRCSPPDLSPSATSGNSGVNPAFGTSCSRCSIGHEDLVSWHDDADSSDDDAIHITVLFVIDIRISSGSNLMSISVNFCSSCSSN